MSVLNDAGAIVVIKDIRDRAERERARYDEDAPHCRSARDAYTKVISWCDEIIKQSE